MKYENRIEQIIEELKQPAIYEEENPFQFTGFQSETSKEEFIKNVEIAKEHIKAGDIFQVVLSQKNEIIVSRLTFITLSQASCYIIQHLICFISTSLAIPLSVHRPKV